MENSPTPTYPFKEPVGNQIGKGTFWGESKVMEHGDDWVIKETIAPTKNNLETLAANKADYDFFRERLDEYIPVTQFIRGQNAAGEPVNLVRQKRIRGKTLSEFSREEIMSNDSLRTQLADLFQRCIVMWEKDGRIPDLSPKGGPLKTTNIMVEDSTGKIYLVDTSAPKKYFSRDAFFIFRLRSRSSVGQMKAFLSEIRKK